MNLFLLVLKILLDLYPNASHKNSGVSKALLEKGLEFVSSGRNGTIALNLYLVLLQADVNFILEKRGRKKDAFKAYSTGRVEMIFALSTEVVALRVRASIV